MQKFIVRITLHRNIARCPTLNAAFFATLGWGFHGTQPAAHLPHLQSCFVDPARIAELLRPFLETQLTPAPLQQISTYIDLLLRWNQRINLTAIRAPEEIVTRHFGESLFAARQLYPRGAHAPVCETPDPRASPQAPPLANDQPAAANDLRPDNRNPLGRLLDVGSGAGFPGLPIKIWSPQTPVTLIESRQKKVAFLREVIRALTLTDIDVFAGRAEAFPPATAGIATLRAIERFDQVLPIAAARLAPAGTLALLIGESQADLARESLPRMIWKPPIPIPLSCSRILLVGYVPLL
jgi:16S rRNA (guanine527-N7)-methyltransferase